MEFAGYQIPIGNFIYYIPGAGVGRGDRVSKRCVDLVDSPCGRHDIQVSLNVSEYTYFKQVFSRD